jgi:hypothetical protein
MEPLLFGTLMTAQGGDLHRLANSALPNAPITPESRRRRPLRRILTAFASRDGVHGRSDLHGARVALEQYATPTSSC